MFSFEFQSQMPLRVIFSVTERSFSFAKGYPLRTRKTCERLLFCFLESFHDSDENCPLRDNSFLLNVLLVGVESVRRHLSLNLKCLLTDSQTLILLSRGCSVLSLNLK